jgi:cytochrome P450
VEEGSGERRVKPSESEGPPGPSGPSARRNSRQYVEAPLVFLQGLQRTYGDVVHFKLGLQDVYLVSDPELIRDVLVTDDSRFARVAAGPIRGYSRLVGPGLLGTSEGERYKRQRRLVQPAFNHGRLQTYASIMVNRTSRLAETFQEGIARDLHEDMVGLTLGIIAESLFGADFPDDTLKTFCDCIETLFGTFDRQGSRYASFEDQRTKDALETLDQIIYQIIQERRQTGTDEGDLLSMLLLAQDAEGDGTGMPDHEVRGEILSLIAAGHDTVSGGLTWTLYALSQHPDVESRLQRELQDVLGDRRPSAGDLGRLPWLEMLVAESLRLYPPSALGTDRLVLEEYQLGRYRIPAGAIILMSQYVVQRDPRWFPDPERFDPERWTPDLKSSRPTFTYFPFSGGSRTCIGWGFALMELSLVVATIAQRWHLELEPGHRVEMESRVSTMPRYGMRMVPLARPGVAAALS